jgi:hypothetical protein
MALRARLVAPPPSPEREWLWHSVLSSSIAASSLFYRDRRMEAESYLTHGYGIRLAIEAKTGWVRFNEIASASAPPRIKQILVAPDHGVPYLNTSQVFDVRPKPRKWLSMEKTVKGEKRLVTAGTILVMASATVGRSIVATHSHENAIVSHHFMRVEPNDPTSAGWVYAYLRSPQARAMMNSSQYASVIRHIEPHHLAMLPVPAVSEVVAEKCAAYVSEIVSCRNLAAEMTVGAERVFLEALGGNAPREEREGFGIVLSEVLRGRRRFEAAYHSPTVRAILSTFKKWEKLGDLTDGVWWGNRFKRSYGDSGIPYLSADDVFTMNPYDIKQILVDHEDGHEQLFVKQGWIIMACSGQTYGMNGSAMIATQWHENAVFSHDMIRIVPARTVRPGFLLTALTHPTLGRPVLIREAYGTSIPHLDPQDVAAFPVVRLEKLQEDRIADLAESAADHRARAEVVERQLSEYAGKIIAEFMTKH